MYSLFFLGLSSFCLALLLTPLSRNLFQKLNRFDHPDHSRKLHRLPVPRAGGAPIVIAYIAAFALLVVSPLAGGDMLAQSLPLARKLIPAALVLFATGLADDLVALKPWQKFAGQFIAAGLACSAGITIRGIGIHTIPACLGIPLTFLWLAACSNAFNLIDGLDGLAAGIGLCAALTTLTGALLTGHLGLAYATAPLAGALLGFLWFNFHPASVFLGDSGSLTIGFLLGCCAILWSHRAATLFGMAAPLMALSIPLTDTALAVGRRILRRQPVFAADHAHIHHKLLERGLTPRRAALVLYGVCAIAAAFAILQSVANKPLAGALIVLFSLAAWFSVRLLGYTEFAIAGRLMAPSTFLRVLGVQIRLRAFEETLSEVETAEQCWEVVRDACRDFGFARVVMHLSPEGRDQWFRHPASSSSCWMLRIPLSQTDYVNIGHEFGSGVEPMLLAGFAAVLRRVLEPKLPLLHDVLAPVVEAPHGRWRTLSASWRAALSLASK